MTIPLDTRLAAIEGRLARIEALLAGKAASQPAPEPDPTPAPSDPPPVPMGHAEWLAALDEIEQDRDRLSEWESSFVAGQRENADRYEQPTPKAEVVLRRLVNKLRRPSCDAASPARHRQPEVEAPELIDDEIPF